MQHDGLGAGRPMYALGRTLRFWGAHEIMEPIAAIVLAMSNIVITCASRGVGLATALEFDHRRNQGGHR